MISNDMQLSKKIASLLLRQKKTLSAAESCTGGLLAHTLTNIPGSSAFFHLGIIAYDDAAKAKLLKVPTRTLGVHGAVSQPAARLMAQNVRHILKTDLGVGITGIAGPWGGSRAKPVGLTYIAVSDGRMTVCRKFHFHGTRASNKSRAVQAALRLILSFL
ncbi:MAG: CinA family protein [Candidatus Omnitrophica bacterium]|nr:CinA family protein [Candidatus Omnitrophota bacterium]